jgi:TonB-dependent starch-binding outer membrane protein SusC
MNTRRIHPSFSARIALVWSCLVSVGACHTYPGGPVLPAPVPPDAVNVGYGTQEKRDVNGAVAKADGEKLMASSPRTISDMLVGRFAGVEVTQLANGGTSIRIRGSHSMKANQEPLFVLDGIPLSDGSATLKDLDPRDIASIDVLKDAAATSVYGSRGANGVILIALKHK